MRGCAGITPPILSEMYGNKHFGAIYTANALAEGAGSYAMATWLFSAVYEREIGQGSGGSASGSDGADGKDCYGRQCFLWTAWISAVLCAFSALLCVWLGAPQNPSCALSLLRALLRARAVQAGGRSRATTRCKARGCVAKRTSMPFGCRMLRVASFFDDRTGRCVRDVRSAAGIRCAASPGHPPRP